MKATWFCSILVLGLSAVAPRVQAQPAPAGPAAPVPGFFPGERLRLRTATGKVYAGRLVSADDFSFTVTSGDGFVLRVDRNQLSGMEVAQPRSRGAGALRGALKGAAGLALLGGALYAADSASKRPDGLCGDLTTGIQTCMTGGDLASAVAGGAMIGAILGAVFPGEHWIHLKPDALRVGLGPAPGGGLALRASMSF